MSIPLDRLYDHLYHKSNHDMLIYGWIPHGSKKLEDLKTLRIYNEDDSNLTKPIVIFHDQEPLDYNLYSHHDFLAQIEKRWSQWPVEKKQFVACLHLRSVIAPRFSFVDQQLIVHSEKNSQQLEQYQQNNFIGVYFWSHALIAADWFRYAEHDTLLKPDLDNLQKTFLIYNRAWCGTREYRLTFTNEICRSNLQSQCLISFSAYDNGVYYKDHVFANKELSVQFVSIEDLLPYNTHDSNASADYNSFDYNKCGLEIVLETLFDDTRWHLTEKTIRPIACGRPFILMATPGSLEYLRSYGFETFNDCIDETYDTIQDPTDRLRAVVAEMTRIARMSDQAKKILWNKLYKISLKNQQLFFSKTWQNKIENEFFENLDSALLQLLQKPTGQIRKHR